MLHLSILSDGPIAQTGAPYAKVPGIRVYGMLCLVNGKKRRRKRQTSLHGQAIRMMQNLGMDNMGAYPFVRAAIIGHANRDRPGNCNQLYLQCPSGTDQLLSYFNNHNGGVLQNALPSVTNEVGSLFPGISSLPQVNVLL